MVGLITNLKNKYNLKEQYPHCKNAGENVTYERACKQEGHFKYNIQPQVLCNRNFNHVHAMLNGGKFNAYLQNGLWAEAASTATLLKNNLITPNRNLSPFQQFLGSRKRSILSLMQKFGEICITTYKDETNLAKLAIQGTPGIWVGYTEGHPTGTYWGFNPKTKKITLTWGVTFLQKFCSEYIKVEKPVFVTTTYEG